MLAGGYLFTALIVIPYALTFPGAFASTGLLGADLQSPAWLYNFWHIGSPVAILAYAVLKDTDRLNIGRAPSAWFSVSWTVALAIGLVSLLTWVTTALKQFLPPLFFADAIQLRTVSVSYVVVIQILVAVVTLTALWIRRTFGPRLLAYACDSCLCVGGRCSLAFSAQHGLVSAGTLDAIFTRDFDVCFGMASWRDDRAL